MAEDQPEGSAQIASVPDGGRRSTDSATGQFAALAEARRAGLLEGAEWEQLSFRVPKALVEAARRQSGASSTEELGILALAVIAQLDPLAEFLVRDEKPIGPDQELEY